MNRRTLWIAALGVGLLASCPSFSSAQERGPGGFDPARFMEERLNRTKEELGASDEEWQEIKPRIEKVWRVQFTTMASRFGGMGRRGGGDRDRGGDRGGDSQQPSSPVRQAQRDLSETLENKEAAPDAIVTKLKALRDARAKAKAELETAQKELQELLTPRQEAVLVAAGTLE